MREIVLLLTGLFWLFPGVALGAEPSMAELERWLESDELMPPSVSTDQV
ncbi:MAG: hypothetical protein HKM94_03690, partial [Halobacteria archaeon]|nr:hypothetical protein [Halobacteria archaeon]